ncbi:MAG: hypothetical protein MZU84_06655 [Sphingobacterium sp.]|nr:hypothetical protein [Sphingobacterium sp.]
MVVRLSEYLEAGARYHRDQHLLAANRISHGGLFPGRAGLPDQPRSGQRSHTRRQKNTPPRPAALCRRIGQWPHQPHRLPLPGRAGPRVPGRHFDDLLPLTGNRSPPPWTAARTSILVETIFDTLDAKAALIAVFDLLEEKCGRSRSSPR